MAFIIICLLSLLLQLGLKPLAIYCSSSLQHCTILYCAILYFTALYHIVLCYTVLYSTVLNCCSAVLYCWKSLQLHDVLLHNVHVHAVFHN